MGGQQGNGAGHNRRGRHRRQDAGPGPGAFRDEVSPKNKGHRWERLRIDRFLKDEPELCAKPIHAVTTVDLAAWRDKRLAQVQPTSCRRDIALLRAAWGYARKEWHNVKDDAWLALTMPSKGRHRERIYTQEEIDRIVLALGGGKRASPSKTSATRPRWRSSCPWRRRCGPASCCHWSGPRLT